MFCRHCGNEIIDGSRYCDKCGQPVEYRNGENKDNGNSPNNGNNYDYNSQNNYNYNDQNYGNNQNFNNVNDEFAYTMSKKEYFQSEFCSPEAIKRKTRSWIIFGIFTALTLANLVLNIIGIVGTVSSIDTDGSISEIMVEFSKALGVEDVEEMFSGIFESYDEMATGFSAGEIFKIAIGMYLGLTALFYIATIVLSLFAISKTNFGCALASMILSIVGVGTLSAIVGTVFIFVFTMKRNNEYKNYCRGTFFNNSFGNNEPYFG